MNRPDQSHRAAVARRPWPFYVALPDAAGPPTPALPSPASTAAVAASLARGGGFQAAGALRTVGEQRV